MSETIIEVRDIVTRLSGALIHDGVSLSVQRGEVAALIGGSGTGKSVLLKEIIGLIRPQSGSIRLFGEDVWSANEARLMELRRRFGVLFQDGALFSSLTVEQNVAAPLREHTSLAPKECLELARLKIALAGLPVSACGKMPSELSGGANPYDWERTLTRVAGVFMKTSSTGRFYFRPPDTTFKIGCCCCSY